MTRARSLLTLALLLALTGPVQAGRELSADEALALVRAGRIQPLSALLARYPQRLAGHLLDVELEREDGRLVYEVEVIGPDGVVREFYLDAASGEIVKEQIEE